MSLEITQVDDDYKFCPSCQRLKPLGQFNKASRAKDGKQCYCRSCNAIYQMNYKGALQAYLDYINQRGNCCEICGESFTVSVYDFHHVNPESKKFNIPMKAFGADAEAACIEADKCALLCANCHRQEHSSLPHGISLLPEGYHTPDGSTPEI